MQIFFEFFAKKITVHCILFMLRLSVHWLDVNCGQTNANMPDPLYSLPLTPTEN